jgi:hypothetical protein
MIRTLPALVTASCLCLPAALRADEHPLAAEDRAAMDREFDRTLARLPTAIAAAPENVGHY